VAVHSGLPAWVPVASGLINDRSDKRAALDLVKLEDKNAALIADTLIPLIEQNKLQIPRGGYLVRRGRGRIIVERPS